MGEIILPVIFIPDIFKPLNAIPKLMKRLLNGYTLIEMLVTVAIVAILAAVAVPSYDGLMNNNKQKSALNSFLGELHYARSEAVKRSRQIMLCPSSDASSCSSSASWTNGWIIFIDDDRDDVRDNDEELLRIASTLDSGLAFATTPDIANHIRYRPNGLAMETGTLTLCDPRGSDLAKAIIINATGRPQISEHNQIGGALTCN